MKHDLQTAALSFVPLMLAALAVLETVGRWDGGQAAATPANPPVSVAGRAASDTAGPGGPAAMAWAHDAAAYERCKAWAPREPAVAHRRGADTGRSQSPDWQRRQQAEIETCLRAAPAQLAGR